jgi:hypothetical protein
VDTLSLHDALPICQCESHVMLTDTRTAQKVNPVLQGVVASDAAFSGSQAIQLEIVTC